MQDGVQRLLAACLNINTTKVASAWFHLYGHTDHISITLADANDHERTIYRTDVWLGERDTTKQIERVEKELGNIAHSLQPR